MNILDEVTVICKVGIDGIDVSFKDIKNMEQGDMIKLSKMVGEKVSLYIEGEENKVIAYGIIGEMNGRYAIKITELCD